MTDIAPVEDWSWECPEDPWPAAPPPPPPLPVMHQAPLKEFSLEEFKEETEISFAMAEEFARQSRYSEVAPHLRYSEFDVTIPIKDHLEGDTCPVVGIECKGARTWKSLKRHLRTQKHMA
ncbi:uncharacterized protein NECHADRAFT_102300 [Fusarium vanettenii 77-13-4]|uniref:Expressed protein n=1 Tax=Fusarium vanettenii (strain ATCC MYA-4622 / CBS 123669 / FGSC 9596 / NRRL 45880 / 77-13-4) TaxID=660122 RepID=C7ZR06_FUSV7|nr:uncharacterized protein NECHADRAFT_102300 [Fusarium vanettenii 77-13-4]EEU33549.1 expressed protein [Fusarium vanettenii 77-13-4]